MDYGRPILFGDFVLPDSMRPSRPLELAVRAEALGMCEFDTFVIGETQEDVEAELKEFLENVAPKARELVAEGRESF